MASENTQSKIRHIPIFVEGRDEPVINKGSNNQSTNNTPTASATSYASAEANSNSQPYQQQQNQRPPMGFSNEMPQHHNMGFNNDMTMPSSIFERAKDFPVRDFFTRSASPRRSESPSQRQMPGYQPQQQQHHPNNQARHSPSPSQQPPPQRTQQQQQHLPNQFQSEQNQGQRATTPQRQQQAEQESQQQKQAEQPAPPKPNPIELSISKIQNIQKAVIEIMEQVEKFDGKSRKEYLYLDEMLTQNLLKLDTIDGNGNEIIKQSRRAAIKSVNALINNLEAKYEAAKEINDANNNGKSEANDVKTSGSGSSVGSHKNNSQNGFNTASKNSSYDNIQQTKSNNSVNMNDVNKELIDAAKSTSQQSMDPLQ